MQKIPKNSKNLKNDGHFRIPHHKISLKQFSNICENVVYFFYYVGGCKNDLGFSQNKKILKNKYGQFSFLTFFMTCFNYRTLQFQIQKNWPTLVHIVRVTRIPLWPLSGLRMAHRCDMSIHFTLSSWEFLYWLLVSGFGFCCYSKSFLFFTEYIFASSTIEGAGAHSI